MRVKTATRPWLPPRVSTLTGEPIESVKADQSAVRTAKPADFPLMRPGRREVRFTKLADDPTTTVSIATVCSSRALAEKQRHVTHPQLPMLRCASQATETRLMLNDRLNVIASHLDRLDPGRDRETLKIFVGCEDFLKGAQIATNVCMDPETVYQSIATDMRALSRRHPGVVLCPGTVYVSTEIPAQHGVNNLKFEQDGRRARMDSTTCYTTNLMPVLYDGEVIAIIRKGERVAFRPVQSNQRKKITLQPLDSIEELARFIDQPGRLMVTSYHEDHLTDLCDEAGKTSTCYLGKTLMPGERELIERYILNGSNRTIADLGRHDATIAGKRFLFLVCAEFRLNDREGNNISTTGRLLTDDNAPAFDFLIHSTVGGDVPPSMQKNARWYVHSDFGGNNKVLGPETNQPLEAMILEDTFRDNELFIY